MKKRIYIGILLCTFLSLTGCSQEKELQETTTSVQETTEEETIKNVKIPEGIETEKDENGDDIYINLDPVPEENLDEDGNIQLTDDQKADAIEEGGFTLYNETDQQKALAYTVPDGLQVLDLISADQAVVANSETGTPYMMTILDGTKEENRDRMEAEFEEMNSYTITVGFDVEQEVTLAGFDCLLLRENYYSHGNYDYREYTVYCMADYLGNTILLQLAEDEEYLPFEEDLSLEEQVLPDESNDVLTNVEIAKSHFEKVLSGIGY